MYLNEISEQSFQVDYFEILGQLDSSVESILNAMDEDKANGSEISSIHEYIWQSRKNLIEILRHDFESGGDIRY